MAFIILPSMDNYISYFQVLKRKLYCEPLHCKQRELQKEK